MNLDERAFKTAVRRVWGREAAPSQLRTHVEQLLRTGRAGVAALPEELGVTLLGRPDRFASNDALFCVIASTCDGTLVAVPVVRQLRQVRPGEALASRMGPSLNLTTATPN